jgi:hypothetical protein
MRLATTIAIACITLALTGTCARAEVPPTECGIGSWSEMQAILAGRGLYEGPGDGYFSQATETGLRLLAEARRQAARMPASMSLSLWPAAVWLDSATCIPFGGRSRFRAGNSLVAASQRRGATFAARCPGRRAS